MTERTPPVLEPKIVALAAQRDEAAMDAFFQFFFPRVYGYVRSLVRNQALADDVVQDAFLRLHRSLDRLDPERDPAPWVFTVVTNTIRDRWRRWEHKNRGRIVDVDDLWDQPSSEPDALEELERSDRSTGIRRALDHLSPADREVILLRTYEGLRWSEVAEATGVSEQALRQRHSRAVKRLGKTYEELTKGEIAR